MVGELSQRAKQSWPAHVDAVYDAAATSYADEVNAREDLGRRLAAARQERRLSQKQLSEISGIQQAEISRIERGRANPTLATLERFTGPLGVRLSVA
ncbi:helix-turn-helix domain-containing protein [Corynebacterium testudinoris]|uniref:helix-turn-helix domain-containing protein n=1 Tax=Corynebacterium testudinoris TaxID=136857 RepID=UPI0009FCAC30|nr:helix-turn-helix transcriptional regulator [Corynebacterium testudinoris]